jgi:hypothetical protein
MFFFFAKDSTSYVHAPLLTVAETEALDNLNAAIAESHGHGGLIDLMTAEDLASVHVLVNAIVVRRISEYFNRLNRNSNN